MLTNFLRNADRSEMKEYFPHIAEALDIDVSEVANRHTSMVKAISEAVARVDESDIPAVVKEIRSFFEEMDDDVEEMDDEEYAIGPDGERIKTDKKSFEEAYNKKKHKKEEEEHDDDDDEDDDDDDLDEAYGKKHKKEMKYKKEEDDDDDDDDHMDEAYGKKKHKKEYAEEMDDDDDDDDMVAEKKRKKMKKESYHITAKDIDITEDADAVFNGESLTEEFQNKAKTIFESAVVRKVNEKLDEIIEEYDDLFEEKVEEISEDIADKVDEYLTYVVEEWAKENELAIESGIRVETTNSLLDNLKSVFEEHYIDVPEDKVSVVEELQRKIEELEGGLNESLNENAALAKQLRESQNDDLFDEVSQGLTEMQKEKFRKLSEGISHEEDNETYREKLEIIKENYFQNSERKTVLTEDFDDDENITDPSENISGAMQRYAESLNRLGLGKK